VRNPLFPLYRRFVRRLSGTGLDRIALFHAAHRFVGRRLSRKSVRVFGKTLFLDPGADLDLSFLDRSEPEVTAIFERHVGEGDTVVDIGAHIGYHTLFLAQRVGPRGKVYAFEPHPDNAALLRKTVAENGFANVVVEQKAVWNETGTGTLFESPHNTVDHRMVAAGKGRAPVIVETVALDDYFEAGTRVDLVKMDMQGAEGQALTGMQRLIADQERIAIVTEFEPWGLEALGTAPRVFLEALVGAGCTLFDIGAPSGTQTPTDPDNLIANCPFAKDCHTNVLCLKGPWQSLGTTQTQPV